MSSQVSLRRLEQSIFRRRLLSWRGPDLAHSPEWLSVGNDWFAVFGLTFDRRRNAA